MELALEGKVALVTGSSRGIGRGIALTLAEEGCDLILHGRDQTALDEVAGEVGKRGRNAVIEVIDLHEAGAPAALVTAVKRAGGRLDILVDNAGGTRRGSFLALTDDDWRDGYGVKFFAHVRLARAAWPLLKASGGSLITIAGISGKEPEAEFTIGSSVNAACVAFTKALADLGKTDGVQVNAINPGRVETDRLWRRIRERGQSTGESEAKVRRDFQQELGITRFGRTDDIAALIAFIASPHGRWLHGATIDMDGGEVRAV
jgi:3-oxoacyl-[acyl-carrier protein] reductase